MVTCWQLSTCSPVGRVYEVARPPSRGRLSNRDKRKPASASATAEDSPASPPPITIRLFESIFARPPAALRPHQDPRFFPSREAHAAGTDIIPAAFNFRQNAAVDPAQRPERGATVAIDHGKKLPALPVEAPGALGLESEQLTGLLSRRRCGNFGSA